MPDPGFTRPDLYSIRAAAEQKQPAGTARGGLNGDGHLLAGDERPAPQAAGIDRAIRLSTAAAVLAVAGIAAYVSYGHACAVVRAHGETGIRYRFPRPSRRLLQTRLEPRERQQKLESHDLPLPAGRR